MAILNVLFYYKIFLLPYGKHDIKGGDTFLFVVDLQRYFPRFTALRLESYSLRLSNGSFSPHPPLLSSLPFGVIIKSSLGTINTRH